MGDQAEHNAVGDAVGDGKREGSGAGDREMLPVDIADGTYRQQADMDRRSSCGGDDQNEVVLPCAAA